jgi:hypothetical protein
MDMLQGFSSLSQSIPIPASNNKSNSKKDLSIKLSLIGVSHIMTSHKDIEIDGLDKIDLDLKEFSNIFYDLENWEKYINQVYCRSLERFISLKELRKVIESAAPMLEVSHKEEKKQEKPEEKTFRTKESVTKFLESTLDDSLRSSIPRAVDESLLTPKEEDLLLSFAPLFGVDLDKTYQEQKEKIDSLIERFI